VNIFSGQLSAYLVAFLAVADKILKPTAMLQNMSKYHV
jgi:hypothetical protein